MPTAPAAPRRRFGRLATVVAVAGLAVTLGACANASGSGSLTGAGTSGQPGVGAPGAGSSATGLPATPIASTPATGGGSGSGSTTGGTPATHPYPSDYFGAILTAWNNHDTAYLTLLTSTATRNQLYGLGNINKHWTLVSSEGAMGSSYGSFYNAGGDWIVLRTINDATSQHQWHAGTVQTWDVMTFPHDATTYVKHFVDAWINGNQARMTLLANASITSTFMAMSNKPDFSYTTGTPDGTAGHTHIEVTEPSLSIDFDLAVVNASIGLHHAIDACDLGC